MGDAKMETLSLEKIRWDLISYIWNIFMIRVDFRWDILGSH
ncbi:mCG147294 [Mus musculus]|nr:mCG147294 [Mus musculus]